MCFTSLGIHKHLFTYICTLSYCSSFRPHLWVRIWSRETPEICWVDYDRFCWMKSYCVASTRCMLNFVLQVNVCFVLCTRAWQKLAPVMYVYTYICVCILATSYIIINYYYACFVLMCTSSINLAPISFTLHVISTPDL